MAVAKAVASWARKLNSRKKEVWSVAPSCIFWLIPQETRNDIILKVWKSTSGLHEVETRSM